MIDKKNHFEYNTQKQQFLTDIEEGGEEFLDNVIPFMSITDTFNDRVIKNVQNKPNKHNKSYTSE